VARFYYRATLSGAQVLFCPPTKGRRSEWGRYPSRTVPFITLWGFVALQGTRIFLIVLLWIILLSGAALWLLGRSAYHVSGHPGDRCRLVSSVTILPPRPFEVRCKKAGCYVGGREPSCGADRGGLRKLPCSVEYTTTSLSMGIHGPSQKVEGEQRHRDTVPHSHPWSEPGMLLRT
jgi:hypothetical protein